MVAGLYVEFDLFVKKCVVVKKKRRKEKKWTLANDRLGDL